MELPEFLTDDGEGEIRLAGHRVWLHHLLYFYNQGHSAEMLGAQYPTIDLALIHKVIVFYLENQEEVDAYLAKHAAEMQAMRAAGKKVPFEELGQRFEALRRTRAI